MKYRVTVSQTVVEEAIVEVEAENEQQAERRAIDIAIYDDVEWSFADAQGDYEVTEINAKETSGA